MIQGAFGLPRCGKTTWLASIAFRERLKIYQGVSNYTNIVSTTPLFGADLVTREQLLDYNYYNTLILIDEVSLFFGNRDWKKFGERATHMFAMHGHFGNSIVWCTQKVDDVDVKIFALTEKLYYVKKCRFGSKTKLYLCPHAIAFNEQTARPVQGFFRPRFFSRLFAIRLHRRDWYDCFDTHAQLDQFTSGHDTYRSGMQHFPFLALHKGFFA